MITKVGRKQYRAILKRELPVLGDQGERQDSRFFNEFREEPLSIKLHNDPGVCGPYRYDRLVFVEDVESVEPPEGFVPTLVRFQTFDNLPRFVRSALYVFGEAGFKFLFALPDNEIDMVVTCPVGVAMAHDGDHHQVESRTGIMDCVADDCTPVGRDAFVDPNLPDALASVRIFLNNDGIRLAGVERLNLFGHLPDVAFGPFDL